MTERSERVWVAVGKSPIASSARWYKHQVVEWMAENFPPQLAARFTIRRATLTLDPVKPKRRTK